MPEQILHPFAAKILEKYLDKSELDDAILIFNQIKTKITQRIYDTAKGHQDKSKSYLAIAENINPSEAQG